MKAVSWDKFTGTDMGAACNFLVYSLVKHDPNRKTLLREVVPPVITTPIQETSTLTARSTSKWSVSLTVSIT